MVTASSTSRPRRPRRARSGKPAQAERDREHADVQADEREGQRDGAPSACGVSTATAISCSNAVPVDVRTLTRCASPATHGYGMWSCVRPRCSQLSALGCVNAQYASSTITCAMVTASGPSFMTVRWMPSEASVARSIVEPLDGRHAFRDAAARPARGGRWRRSAPPGAASGTSAQIQTARERGAARRWPG